ncbi:MAG: hypothetical protein WD688_21260 [Candidatus Binatia bacterium]
MPRTSRDILHPEHAALFLISRTQRPITLEVETAHSQTTRAAKEYLGWSGQSASWAKLTQTGFALDVGQKKWGIQYRIYFVKDQTVKNQLERYGCRIIDDGDVRYQGTFRVNSRSLFRELVERHGLRLGENM